MGWGVYRAAGALEEAAREYKKRTGRPFVLVVDAVDRLAEHCPDLLATFQASLPTCSVTCQPALSPANLPAMLNSHYNNLLNNNTSNTCLFTLVDKDQAAKRLSNHCGQLCRRADVLAKIICCQRCTTAVCIVTVVKLSIPGLCKFDITS